MGNPRLKFAGFEHNQDNSQARGREDESIGGGLLWREIRREIASDGAVGVTGPLAGREVKSEKTLLALR